MVGGDKFDDLEEGDTVKYRWSIDEKRGKPRAEDVSVVERRRSPSYDRSRRRR